MKKGVVRFLSAAGLLACLVLPAAALASGDKTLIYYASDPVNKTQVVKVKSVDTGADGKPVFTLEDGQELTLGDNDRVEIFRAEDTQNGGKASVSLFFPLNGLYTAMGTLGNVLSPGYVEVFNPAQYCKFGLDRLPDYPIAAPAGTDCSFVNGSGRGMDWTNPKSLEEMVTGTGGGQYPFKFTCSIGRPEALYTAGPPAHWLFYIQNMNTPAEMGAVNRFYIRVKLYDRVYFDMKEIEVGGAGFISLSPDLINASGKSKEELMQDMEVEINGYDKSDWAYWDPDKIIAKTSGLTPVVDFHPKSKTTGDEFFDMLLTLASPGLGGVSSLDTGTFNMEYNDADITQPFLDGVANGAFSVSTYADDPGEAGKYAKFLVKVPDVDPGAGTHTFKSKISDKDGNTAVEWVHYVKPKKNCHIEVSPLFGGQTVPPLGGDFDMFVSTKLGSETNVPDCIWAVTENVGWIKFLTADSQHPPKQKLAVDGDRSIFIGSGDGSVTYRVSRYKDAPYCNQSKSYESRVETLITDSNDETFFVVQEPKDEDSDASTGPGIGETGDEWVDPLTGMAFVWVDGGCYEMGCGSWMTDCNDNEYPAHKECVDGFWMGKYEVTQMQWKLLMGNKGPYGMLTHDYFPMTGMSTGHATAFCDARNQKITGGKFRLPTEAEWEYAARSGGKNEVYSGGGAIDAVAWYDENSENEFGSKGVHEVGLKQSNGLGIHDMSGNVSEWCGDLFLSYTGKSYFQYNVTVIRGGTFESPAWVCRTTTRKGGSKGTYLYGFRLVFSPSKGTNQP